MIACGSCRRGLLIGFFGKFSDYEVTQQSGQRRLRGGRMPPLRIGDILSPSLKALHIEFATKFREEPLIDCQRQAMIFAFSFCFCLRS